MTNNDQLKSAVAAVVLAGFNLWAVLSGHHVSTETMATVVAGLALVASYFAPRISYLGHAYAGTIGAIVGGILALLNALLVVWAPGKGVVAAISTVVVAIGALLVPSLTRSTSS